MNYYLAYKNTPLGLMQIISNEDGIYLLEFSNDEKSSREAEKILNDSNATVVNEANSHIRVLEEELDNYFQGTLQKFTVPVVLSGSDFQNKVWKKLMDVPYGTTRTYKEQSITYGDLKAIRAVATANSANKLAIIIPCHRIIGSDGSMTGYAGGIEKKKFLLNLEREIAGPKDLFNQ